MLSDEEISELYARYSRGDIDSTELQGLLRPETAVPTLPVFQLILDFMNERRQYRESNPQWREFLLGCMKDYMFFISILGLLPKEMSYTQFAKFAVEHGSGRQELDAMTEEDRSAFWKQVQEIDMEISVFGDEL